MRNRLILVSLIVAAGAVLWFIRPPKQEVAARTTTEPAPAPSAVQESSPPTVTNVENAEVAVDTNPPPAPEETVAGADPAHPTQLAILQASTGPEIAPGLTPAIVMENVRRVFRQYSSRLGGNPVGTNPEITAALNGKNPKQIVFLNSDDGLRINEQGELIDNWGTPFFFHQLSAQEMEIHSAGPDRKMWTADDLVLK